jgi:hypothetical protein
MHYNGNFRRLLCYLPSLCLSPISVCLSLCVSISLCVCVCIFVSPSVFVCVFYLFYVTPPELCLQFYISPAGVIIARHYLHTGPV